MSVTRDNQLNNIPADHNSSSGTLTRPLIQNPNAAFSPKNTNISEVPSYYDFTSQNTNLLPLNHHLGMFLLLLLFTHLLIFICTVTYIQHSELLYTNSNFFFFFLGWVQLILHLIMRKVE